MGIRLHFWGAAQTVTGSSHHMECAGQNILLDCGLFQGHRQEARGINEHLALPMEQLNAVVLSHAHIDHSKSYPEFHQGAAGYARYFWHTEADTADENFMVGGLGPIAFHQDSRFYTLGHGGFRKRTWYAVTRVLVSRSDNGNKMFNFSEIVGSGAAAGVGSLYYPSKYRTWTKVGQRWLTSDLIDCFNFFWKEYWPDVNKKVFHTK